MPFEKSPVRPQYLAGASSGKDGDGQQRYAFHRQLSSNSLINLQLYLDGDPCDALCPITKRTGEEAGTTALEHNVPVRKGERGESRCYRVDSRESLEAYYDPLKALAHRMPGWRSSVLASDMCTVPVREVRDKGGYQPLSSPSFN